MQKRLSEKKRFSIIARARSFKYALRGIHIILKTQHNFWIQIIGAIIVVDHFLADKFGIATDPALKSGSSFNIAVLLAWLVPVGIAMYAFIYHDVFASYLPLPTAIACGFFYVVLSKTIGPKAVRA